MNISNSSSPRNGKERPLLLTFCLLFSILLHLLVVYLLPYENLRSDNLATRLKDPTIVRLVDKPAATERKEYELDQKPAQPTPEPPPKSSRLAEQNQRVEKEMAPKGDDVRDQTAKPAVAVPGTPLREKKSAPSAKPKQQKTPRQTGVADKSKRPDKKDGKLTAAPEQAPQAVEQTGTSLPSLEQLTQLTPDTINRMSSANRATDERIKQRDDVEIGDTVWLNLERGLLISFFRRFRNQIEGVWNYPREAIEKEQQGTLLLKITVDAKGNLLDVDLEKSSGSEILDYEAIQAVYRAAPFGPLGKHYPHPDLKIMAHFQYRLSGKFIYGQRR
jgi:protein TonB